MKGREISPGINNSVCHFERKVYTSPKFNLGKIKLKTKLSAAKWSSLFEAISAYLWLPSCL